MARKIAEKLGSKKMTFMNMPIDAMHKIVDKVDPINRLVLRKVCRKLRNFLDNRDPGFKHIEIKKNPETFCLVLDKTTINYHTNRLGCTVQLNNGLKKVIEKKRLDALLDDLAVVMKNSKLKLDTFELKFVLCNSQGQIAIAKFFQDTSKSRSLFHAKKISFYWAKLDDTIAIISYFKPGILETIWILSCPKNIRALYNMEQWKQAKSVNIHFNELTTIPVEHLAHLSEFLIQRTTVSVSEAVKIRDVLMKSAHFECGIFQAYSCPLEPGVEKVFNPGNNRLGSFRLPVHTVGGYSLFIGSDYLRIKKI